MALSPQHVARRLSFDDVSYLLAGLDPAMAEGGYYHRCDLENVPYWQRVMVEAIIVGELEPDEGGALLFTSEQKLIILNNDSDWTMGGYDPKRHEVCAWFPRLNVIRWLKSRGIAGEDIPEALRAMPVTKKVLDDDDLNPRREVTYQRIIAALLAIQYGMKDLENPYRLSDAVLDDCSRRG